MQHQPPLCADQAHHQDSALATTHTDAAAGQVSITALCRAAKQASRELALLSEATKNSFLVALADAILAEQATILAANAKDMAAAQQLSEAMQDRLLLTPARLAQLAEAVRVIASLPDPVGQIRDLRPRPNGIQVGKMRIPLGVIAMIYEARPNVTIDAGALCFKAGNAVILRGGREALHSSLALAAVMQQVLRQHGLPTAAVTVLPDPDRALLLALLQQRDSIDLVIPRGGEGLIEFVTAHSKIPVIQHYKGICHLYVDVDADLTQAMAILQNGKTQRPGVCNALETLLLHADIAADFLPRACAQLANVRWYGCPLSQALCPDVLPAAADQFDTEYLALAMSVKIVPDMAAAIAHIAQHSSGHTEVICTQHFQRAQQFIRQVQSAVVMVNASSRFSDGGELGLGAEIGISTSKLHAYGPMGLEALTTEKYIVLGDGQVR